MEPWTGACQDGVMVPVAARTHRQTVEQTRCAEINEVCTQGRGCVFTHFSWFARRDNVVEMAPLIGAYRHVVPVPVCVSDGHVPFRVG